ncbi:MAG: hypothetical protein RIS75_73 [Actinomycetota bacterium]
MKKGLAYYSATVSAAAIFASVATAGLAWADDDDYDDEDEDDDDDEVVLNLCDWPELLADKIDKEVNDSYAVKAAKKNLDRAVSNVKSAVKSEVSAQKVLAELLKKKKPNEKALKTAQTKYLKAVASTVSLRTAQSTAQLTYNTVIATTRASIESRYATDCGTVPVDPTPTPTPTVPVDPTPTPTVPVDPTPTPTVPVDPTPTPTVPVDPTPTVPVDPTPTVPALAAPTGVKAMATSQLAAGAFRITWNAVTGATSYKVYRDGALIGTPTTTTFTPATVTNAAPAVYTVEAVNATSTSAPSAAISAAPYAGSSAADKKGLKVYGYIKVTLAVTDKRVTGCWATYPTDSESLSINTSAIPKLCAQVITSQTSTVSSISGATATVAAFKISVQAALTAAGI